MKRYIKAYDSYITSIKESDTVHLDKIEDMDTEALEEMKDKDLENGSLDAPTDGGQ